MPDDYLSRLSPVSSGNRVLDRVDRLIVCGVPARRTQMQPRPDTRLGELTKAPDCSLCFDLVKEVTPQG